MVLTPGDQGPVATTKIGGTPWWPVGTPRPRCHRGHAMAFQAQVLLGDAPAPMAGPGLISFHYCLECAAEGRMSFGHGDPENTGYSVKVFADVTGPVDGLGSVVDGCLPAMRVALSDVKEVPSLEDAWALNLELPPELFAEGADLDEDIGLGLIHVARCKVGGWPTWQQSPGWPTCADGQRMHLVAQLDYDLGEVSPWAAGGYAYLFACGSGCRSRTAELVVQTT